MDSSENELNDTPENYEIQLKCVICGRGSFSKRSAQLNTAMATFFNLDWTNSSASCYVCLSCGYIHWFLPPAEAVITVTVNVP